MTKTLTKKFFGAEARIFLDYRMKITSVSSVDTDQGDSVIVIFEAEN